MCGCYAWTTVVLFDNITNDSVEYTTFGQNKVVRQSEGRYTKGSRKGLDVDTRETLMGEERMNERDFVIRWLSG
jgi:hypothetical protein